MKSKMPEYWTKYISFSIFNVFFLVWKGTRHNTLMVFQPFEALNFKKKLKENQMNEHSTIENQSISG